MVSPTQAASPRRDIFRTGNGNAHDWGLDLARAMPDDLITSLLVPKDAHVRLHD